LNFSTSAEFEVVRAIKEKACYVALSPVKEESSDSNVYQYMLPDGNKVDVSLYLLIKINFCSYFIYLIFF